MSESHVPAVTGCHHVAICCHDIEATKQFYGEVIGLRELERPPGISGNFPSVWYQLGETQLHIVQEKDYQPLRSPLAPHVAIRTSDFESVIGGIAARGGKFIYGPAEGPDGNVLVVLADPTGNNLEITTAPVFD